MIQERHVANVPQQGTMPIAEMCPTGVIGGYALCGHTDCVIPNQIAFYRKLAGLTQDQLAEKAGTTRNMLIKLEKGSRDLTSSWLEKLGEALKIEPYKLIAPVGLNDTSQSSAAPDQFQVHPETIEPILDALLLAAPPPGRVADQSRRALSVMLAYALEQLGDQLSSPANPGAGRVAARAALSRFRELGSA